MEPNNTQTIDELEKSLAYHMARSDIEMLCKGEFSGLGKPLWNLATTQHSTEAAQTLDSAIRYLEHRKLLQRRIDNPNIVIILEENEAQQ